MKTKKIILIVIALIITLMFLNLNIVYAEESWDEFYLRFLQATTANGKLSDLTEADIDRMIAGPTKEERENGSTYITADALEWLQQWARENKEDVIKAGKIDDSLSDSNLQDEITNMTNEERKETAKQMRKNIIDYLSGKDISTLNTVTIRRYLQKINEYKVYSGADLDDTMMQYYSQLNGELARRNEKQDTTLFEDQVATDGTVQDGTSSSESTIGSSSMGKVQQGTEHTLGEIISEGKNFINQAEDENIKQEDLKKMSDTIYNILLVVGIIAAVIVGLILGIKFMVEGVEGKAEIQKAFVPYIIGCIVVFGAFTIWKIVVEVLQTM